MKNLSEFFYRKSTAGIAMVAMVIFITFSALVLPGQSAAAETYSSGAGSPDMSLFYSSSDLYQMAKAYGTAGRLAYIHARFTFDLAFPLVYGFFLTACISWLLNKVILGESFWRLLNLAPLIGVVFDLLENISAALVIGRYPAETPVFAVLAPFFTFIKWIFVGGSFVLLFIGFGFVIFSRKKNKS